ncbi:hypothetical protein JYK04_00846 [Streptomyces nojiriensis]|nr:hypothetical protein JYK04_00846 [Streptomyces nojiriensis]
MADTWGRPARAGGDGRTEPRPGDYRPGRGSACVGYRLRADALVALALALERVFLAAPPVLVGALAAAGGSAGLGVGRVLTGSLRALLLLRPLPGSWRLSC